MKSGPLFWKVDLLLQKCGPLFLQGGSSEPTEPSLVTGLLCICTYKYIALHRKLYCIIVAQAAVLYKLIDLFGTSPDRLQNVTFLALNAKINYENKHHHIINDDPRRNVTGKSLTNYIN